MIRLQRQRGSAEHPEKSIWNRLVPRNPDDEPASVLLKRFQAEKKGRTVAAKDKDKDKGKGKKK